MEQSKAPSLVGSVGRYRETAPYAELFPHFRCIWTQTIRTGHAGQVAVVPDGCVDLIWREGRFLVAGPDITAALPELQSGSTILGIRFQPGAAARWLRLPMSEIVGQEVDMAELWGGRARDLSGRLNDLPTVGERARLLQRQLVSMIADIDAAPPDAAAIFSFAGRGLGEERTVPPLLDKLEVSERTLRRRSHSYFGYGPATLARILRLQKFLSLAQSDRNSGLAGLAFDAGFADQPHLSREIRSLCGMTPRTLLRQLRR